MNKIELKISELLDSFPFLKKFVSKTYIILNFFLRQKRGFSFELQKGCELINYKDFLQANYSDDLFYGYYYPSPWNSTSEAIILNKLDRRNMINKILLLNQAESISIGKSRAWNYQQGSLAQWITNNGDEYIIYNDIFNNKLTSVIKDREGNIIKRLSFPVQASHNYNRIASINFRRLYYLRPDYGYNIPVINFPDNLPYEEDGIWLGSAENDIFNLVISIRDLIEYKPVSEMSGSKHKVNHIMFSPDGFKIIFFHRWLSNTSGKFSRLFVYNTADKSLKLLLDEKMISHFCWQGNSHIIVYAKHQGEFDYFQIEINSASVKPFANRKLKKYGDGHPSFSPDGRFVITDTYPDKSRISTLLLYDTKNDNIIEIGRFFSPINYSGIKRCDLHPRWSPNGKYVSFDSTHKGARSSYLLEISKLIKPCN